MERLMTRRAVESLGLKCSRWTFRRLQQKGVLTPIRIGKEVVYKQSEVERLINGKGDK